jgi:tripartite-type tricarboxylate transporter receptor subunit TctC
MVILRRTAMAASLLICTQAIAQAPAWPNKSIRFVVPFAPGGANDLMARSAALAAQQHLGQTILIENRPGAGGTIGSDVVAKSAPDGFVAPNSPYKTLKDLVDASKVGSGLHFATAGTGSTPHFVAEMLNTKYGAKLEPVPYKSGSESTTALIGGQIAATSEASIVSLNYLKSGRLRALATTWTRRIDVYPSLSTAIEQGFPELRISHWAGLHAPKGTPAEVLDKMAAAIDAGMKSQAVVDRLTPLGIQPIGGTRAEFEKFVEAERTRLGFIVRASGMKED